MDNITDSLLFKAKQDIMVFSCVSVGFGCTFLYINGALLFTLSSRPVFYETSRYILLFNLLLTDTFQLMFSEILFLLAVYRITLTLYQCGVLVMLSTLVTVISPVTLMVMSLERYVAVCFPLRHANIATIRNTAVVITAIWVLSFLNILVRISLVLTMTLDFSPNQPMKRFCSKEAMFLVPISYHYDKAYSGFVFTSVGITIVLSYIGVVLVARSASTDKASAMKAAKTVLLHLIQFSLILPSTLHSVILTFLISTVDRLLLLHLNNSFFVICHILPRCLSALIYGLRDPTIRHVLMFHLSCRQKCSVSPTTANIDNMFK